MTVSDMLFILSWPMGAFVMIWVDSLLSDWGLFGESNTILERIILILSILAYILLVVVGLRSC